MSSLHLTRMQVFACRREIKGGGKKSFYETSFARRHAEIITTRVIGRLLENKGEKTTKIILLVRSDVKKINYFNIHTHTHTHTHTHIYIYIYIYLYELVA